MYSSEEDVSADVMRSSVENLYAKPLRKASEADADTVLSAGLDDPVLIINSPDMPSFKVSQMSI